jgi:hypothetical protein
MKQNALLIRGRLEALEAVLGGRRGTGAVACAPSPTSARGSNAEHPAVAMKPHARHGEGSDRLGGVRLDHRCHRLRGPHPPAAGCVSKWVSG